ncbi:MAG TPA: metalloregulator ArsR/SmtB family transcription factor [Symbiobacteriaceae bacterium]
MPTDALPSHGDTSTRREIINILRVSGPLTVSELGERLGITHVAVRRHLTSLERDGLITSVQERHPMGRPTRVYSLTEAADELFPKKYGALTLELLEFLSQTQSELVDQFFRTRGQRLAEQYGPEVSACPTLAERVKRLTQIQAANGYLATSEEGADGTFILREFNCPISQVSRYYPHACEHELTFIRTVLGTDQVQRVECISQGGTCCRYIVGPEEAK